jgi:hypothetical protein
MPHYLRERSSEAQFVIPVKIDGCPMHMFERLIEMAVCRIAPRVGAAVILFAAQIGTGVPKQFDDFVKAAPAVETRIHGRVILEIFPVEHGGAVHFADRSFHLVVGLNQAARHVGLLLDAHKQLSSPHVAAGPKIRRVVAGCVGVGYDGCQDGGQTNKAPSQSLQFHFLPLR